ncbi:MAG: HD domain-containing protein [Desulfobacterales bacterium]
MNVYRKHLPDDFCLPAVMNALPERTGVYMVGGSVRDLLMKKKPSDYDLLVAGDARRFSEKLAENLSRRVVELGKPGQMLYRIVFKGTTFDVSPLSGNSLLSDLENRDFTINAIVYDLKEDRLVDPLNGIQDLETHTVRMISHQAFKNDPIRLLRAYRIASELNFIVDSSTTAAIQNNAFRIGQSAGERIRLELLRLFGSSKSSQYMRHMAQSRLLQEIFPDLKKLEGCTQNDFHEYDVFDHTLNAYGYLEKLVHHIPDRFPECEPDLSRHMESSPKALLKLSMLLHDIGKPLTRSSEPDGTVHFYGHAAAGARMAAAAGQKIKLSRREVRYIDTVIRHHIRPLHLYRLRQADRSVSKPAARFFLNVGKSAPDILIHGIADNSGKRNEPDALFTSFSIQLIRRYFKDFLKKKKNGPLLTGYDLIHSFGLAPSPLFKTILEKTDELHYSNHLKNKAEALVWVRQFLKCQGDSNS